MKVCPKCDREYTDETFSYCLDDGERLVVDTNAAPPTVIMSADDVYEFDNFRLDVSEKTLSRNGKPIPVTPKVFATLQLLIENAGHLLGKDELIKAIWPDQFVEEGNLAYTIR